MFATVMQPQATPSTQGSARGSRLRSVAAVAATLALLLAMAATPANADEGDAAAAEVCSSGARTLSKPGDRVYPEMGNGGYVSEHTDLRIAYDTATNLFLPGTRADLVQRATQCLSDFSLDFERTQRQRQRAEHDGQLGPGRTASMSRSRSSSRPTPATRTARTTRTRSRTPSPTSTRSAPPTPTRRPAPPVGDNTQNGQPCPANKLVITPAAPIPTGTTYTVTVNYTGRPGVHIDGDGSTEGWFRDQHRGCAQRRQLRDHGAGRQHGVDAGEQPPERQADVRRVRHRSGRQDRDRRRRARRTHRRAYDPVLPDRGQPARTPTSPAARGRGTGTPPSGSPTTWSRTASAPTT